MDEAHRAVKRMCEALCQRSGPGTGPNSNREADRLSSFAESIRWKLRFLQHHCGFISNVRWTDVCRLGTPGFADPVRVVCGEDTDDGCVVLEFRTLDSGRMAVLSCFDGIVGACVNSVDTLARILNLAYGLGLEERRANLPMVAQKVDEGCAVGSVLTSDPGVDWMAPVRLLRGECQHANIAVVIREPDSGFGVPARDLFVADEFAIDDRTGMTVATYSQVLRDRALFLLTAIARAIAADPDSSVVPRSTP
jgi:hypothetical protein